MEKFATGGFSNNENGNLFFQVDGDFIGNIGKHGIPHSQKILDSVAKAVAKALSEQKEDITAFINNKENI